VNTKFDASAESRFLLESNRLWRAVQAVGDVAINTGRSSLKRIAEFVSSTTGRQNEIVNDELESYSANPGLGLSRFVGEETISRLRRAASVQFSNQDFHTKLLQQGNVSLSILLGVFGITASELAHLDGS
jgi:uncharacterized protein (DUF885 family)